MKGSPEHPMTVGGYERPEGCGTHYECVCDGLYPQLEWGCSLGSLYVQLPAAGKSEKQGSCQAD